MTWVPFPLLGSGLPAAHLSEPDPYADLSSKAKKLSSFLALRDAPNLAPEVILALGSDFEEVAYQAATLAHLYNPNLVVCAGGRGRHTPSAWGSEARHFADILVGQGVTPSKIVVEDKSTNTGENLRFAKDALLKLGVQPKSILLTLYPILQLRAVLTARKLWSDQLTLMSWAAFLPDFERPIPGWPLGEWRRRLLWESVGEINRLIEYQKPDKQFIGPFSIPGEILQAAHETGEALLLDSSIPPEQLEQLTLVLANFAHT